MLSIVGEVFIAPSRPSNLCQIWTLLCQSLLPKQKNNMFAGRLKENRCSWKQESDMGGGKSHSCHFNKSCSDLNCSCFGQTAPLLLMCECLAWEPFNSQQAHCTSVGYHAMIQSCGWGYRLWYRSFQPPAISNLVLLYVLSPLCLCHNPLLTRLLHHLLLSVFCLLALKPNWIECHFYYSALTYHAIYRRLPLYSPKGRITESSHSQGLQVTLWLSVPALQRWCVNSRYCVVTKRCKQHPRELLYATAHYCAYWDQIRSNFIDPCGNVHLELKGVCFLTLSNPCYAFWHAVKLCWSD